MASASKSIPFVVSPQVVPIPETISQAELALLLSLRRRVHDLEKQIEVAEASLKQQLGRGATVEPGTFRAYLKTVERTNVSWKSVVERELGADYAKRVLAATKPDKYINLVVTA